MMPAALSANLPRRREMDKRKIAGSKRIKLSSETLRNLQDGEYKKIAAGVISHSCTTSCQIVCPMCNT
jgi:hypothetical protein